MLVIMSPSSLRFTSNSKFSGRRMRPWCASSSATMGDNAALPRAAHERVTIVECAMAIN